MLLSLPGQLAPAIAIASFFIAEGYHSPAPVITDRWILLACRPIALIWHHHIGACGFLGPALMLPGFSPFMFTTIRCSALRWRSRGEVLFPASSKCERWMESRGKRTQRHLDADARHRLPVMFEFGNQARWLTGGDDGLVRHQDRADLGPLLDLICWARRPIFIRLVLFPVVPHRLFCGALAVRALTRRHPPMPSACGRSARRCGGGFSPSIHCRAPMAGSAGALGAYDAFVGLSLLRLLTSGIVTVMLILAVTRSGFYGAFIGAAIYYSNT